MAYPPIPTDVPYVTKAQMVEVDRVMIEDYHITLIQMMENAGRSLASLARQSFFDGIPTAKGVVVLAGRGGNGGGALVCARHLANWGAQVTVVISRPEATFEGVPAHQLEVVRRLSISILEADAVIGLAGPDIRPDLIVDGLIGYSLEGAPRGTTAALIRWANAQEAPILALDTPSGLDTTTGAPLPPTIKASATLTLALPKTGLRKPSALPYVGALYLADIGAPPALYTMLSLDLDVGPLFAQGGILHVFG